jgi:hypothetical protein
MGKHNTRFAIVVERPIDHILCIFVWCERYPGQVSLVFRLHISSMLDIALFVVLFRSAIYPDWTFLSCGYMRMLLVIVSLMFFVYSHLLLSAVLLV